MLNIFKNYEAVQTAYKDLFEANMKVVSEISSEMQEATKKAMTVKTPEELFTVNKELFESTSAKMLSMGQEGFNLAKEMTESMTAEISKECKEQAAGLVKTTAAKAKEAIEAGEAKMKEALSA